MKKSNLPKGVPPILYKLRNWNDANHREIIYHQRIYIPRPKELNDPYDCNVQLDYLSLSPEELDAYCKHLVLKYADALIQQGFDLAEREAQLLLRAQNRTQFQLELDEMNFELMNNRIGVLSLSKSWNNIPLWAHYGNNHKGFAIGFKTEKIVDCRYFQVGGEVEYVKTYPKIDPREEFNIEVWLKIITAKSEKWCYESEFRFVRRWENDSNQFWEFSHDWVEEIILGLNFSEFHIPDMIKICEHMGWSLYKIEMTPLSFELNRKQLV